MSNIIPFQFGHHHVRLIDQDGRPMFVASDVAELLGYAKSRNAIARHCKHATTAPKQGGGFITFIPEGDVFRLIMRSKLPEAEAFENWVHDEVLPKIRQTGGYQMAPAIPQSLPEALRLAADLADEVAELKPKALFHDRVAVKPGAITLAEAAKVIGTGRTRLCAFLRRIHWLRRNNEPYQDKIEAGLLDVKLGSWEHPDYGLQRSVTALVTGKGLTKLQGLWSKQKGEEIAA